jgi:glycosyltransferase involved in cell wall biosynthesis
MKQKEKYDVCFMTFAEPWTDSRTLNMAGVFAEAGYSVALIAFGPYSMSSIEKKGVSFLPMPHYKNHRVWRQWFRYQKDIRTYRRTISANNFIACDVFTLPFAAGMAKRSRAKLIYDSREIFSALGPAAANPIKQRVISTIEKIFVRQVDDILVSGRLDADYLKKYFKRKHKYHVVMNLPHFQEPVESNLLRARYAIPEDHIIAIYQGAMLPGRGLRHSIRALGRTEGITLCIFGEGRFMDILKYEAEESGAADRVIFCGRVPYEELHRWTCSADFGLALFRPISISYELALPNKIFEYCMAGIPSIASDLPAMRLICNEHPFFHMIDKNAGADRIAEAMNQMKDPIFREKYTKVCPQASKKYSYESQRDIIESIVE